MSVMSGVLNSVKPSSGENFPGGVRTDILFDTIIKSTSVFIADVEELEFDFSNLAYISSAGLRVLLSAQKIMNRQGNMVIKNANDDIMDVFEVMGFIDILNIE